MHVITAKTAHKYIGRALSQLSRRAEAGETAEWSRLGRGRAELERARSSSLG